MLVYRVELKASILSKYDGWCKQLGPYTGCVGDEDELYEYLDIHGIEFGLNFGVSETRHPAPCEDLRLMRNLKNMVKIIVAIFSASLHCRSCLNGSIAGSGKFWRIRDISVWCTKLISCLQGTNNVFSAKPQPRSVLFHCQRFINANIYL